MVEAVAKLVGAIAWPFVAIGAMVCAIVFFRAQIGGLIDRLREARGLKFDPPPQSGAPPPAGLSTTGVASGAPLPFPRTPASANWEGVIKKWLEGVVIPAQREEVLVSALARVLLIGQFQNLELFIWGSQLALLGHLNGRVDGETLENLKQFFYDPAAAKFPDQFRNYPFEQYLAFLERNAVLATAQGRAQILPAGREYLAWRIEARRPPMLPG